MKRSILFLITASTLVQACMIFMRPPSDPAAYAPTQMSETQLYKATFEPVEPIRVGRLHSWKIRVTTADGESVPDARITVDGGMPQHGHGLPTKPQVTAGPNGDRLIEGMRFNMGGWWVVRLHIDGAQGSDVVTFKLKL